MRTILEIIIHTDGRKSYRIYDDIRKENEEIIGTGWTIRDAVEDFLAQINAESFFDDDTAIITGNGVIEFSRKVIRLDSYRKV